MPVHRDQFAPGRDQRHRAAFAGLRERLGVAAPEHARQSVGRANLREIAITHEVQHRLIEIERLPAVQHHRADRQTIEQRAGVAAHGLARLLDGRLAPRRRVGRLVRRGRGRGRGEVDQIALGRRSRKGRRACLDRRAGGPVLALGRQSRAERPSDLAKGVAFVRRQLHAFALVADAARFFGQKRKRAQRAGADRHDIQAAGLSDAGLSENDDFGPAVAGRRRRSGPAGPGGLLAARIGARLRHGRRGRVRLFGGRRRSLAMRALDDLAGNRFAGEEAETSEPGEAPQLVEDRRPGNQRHSRARAVGFGPAEPQRRKGPAARDRLGEVARGVEADAGVERGQQLADLGRVRADGLLERAIGVAETIVGVEAPQKAAGRGDFDARRLLRDRFGERQRRGFGFARIGRRRQDEELAALRRDDPGAHEPDRQGQSVGVESQRFDARASPWASASARWRNRRPPGLCAARATASSAPSVSTLKSASAAGVANSTRAGRPAATMSAAPRSSRSANGDPATRAATSSGFMTARSAASMGAKRSHWAK